MIVEEIRCPKCGKIGTVNCWRVQRLHCGAYRQDGWICGEPYGSVNDEDSWETDNVGSVKLDCDNCKHEWGENAYVAPRRPEPILDYVI